VGVFRAEHIARELDDRVLKIPRRCRERSAGLAREPDALERAFEVEVRLPGAHHTAVEVSELFRGVRRELRGREPLDFNRRSERDGGVLQRDLDAVLRDELRNSVADNCDAYRVHAHEIVEPPSTGIVCR